MKKDNHAKHMVRMDLRSNPPCYCDTSSKKRRNCLIRDMQVSPCSFRALGVSALSPFPELQKEFVQIVSPSDKPVSKRAERCKKLFIEALAKPQDGYSYESSGESHEQRSNDRVIANRFAWAARREGETMVERNNFEYLPIWECMTFIALQGDADETQGVRGKVPAVPGTGAENRASDPHSVGTPPSQNGEELRLFRSTTIDYSRITTQRPAHSIIDRGKIT